MNKQLGRSIQDLFYKRVTKIFIYIYVIYMGVLPAYVITLHVCSAHGGQKRALNPLDRELQVVVTHHVGDGN